VNIDLLEAAFFTVLDMTAGGCW